MEKQAIQDIIKQARKTKGMTQQDLSEATGLSLRTIQRMEKGDHAISGYSLKQISSVLEISLEKLIMNNVEQVNIETSTTSSIKALYLSSLLFWINPLLIVIVPTILYFNKTNKDPFYEKHFRFILYYTIMSLILAFIIMIIIMFMFGASRGILIVPAYYIATTTVILYRFFTIPPSSEQ